MKKIKQIILTLLVVSFLVNPMYLTLRVHAANEEIAMSRISDTLQNVMEISSEEEPIEVMIWLEDINTSSAVLSSTEDIFAAANATLSPRGLCENPETDAETYSQYMSARKEAMRECYEEYTRRFSDEYLIDTEVLYASRYTHTVLAEMTTERIKEVASISHVTEIDYYNDNTELNTSVNDNSRAVIVGDNAYNTVDEIMHGFGIDTLIEYVDSRGEGINIGVIDEAFPDLSHSMFGNNIIQHYVNTKEAYFYDHPTQIMELLYSIVPEADFYYTTYWQTVNAVEVRTNLATEVEWLLDNDVHLISCSQNLYSQPNKDQGTNYDDSANTYGSIAKYVDELITNYGITFVICAGNQAASGIVSGGMSYNAITVGNYNQRQNSIATSSSYYTGSDWAYKPDICAPGFVYFNTTNTYGGFTSFATPIVAGMAALIIIDGNYGIFPYEVKAILCAGASRELYSIDDPNYRIYGAGVIDGANVASILSNDTYTYDYFTPDEQEHSFTIYFDGWVSPNIALSFEYGENGSNNYVLGNLDLILYDPNGNPVAFSQTTQNNVEIIRFDEDYSGTYTLVVKQITPPKENGAETYVCYSVAWFIEEFN